MLFGKIILHNKNDRIKKSGELFMINNFLYYYNNYHLLKKEFGLKENERKVDNTYLSGVNKVLGIIILTILIIGVAIALIYFDNYELPIMLLSIFCFICLVLVDSIISRLRRKKYMLESFIDKKNYQYQKFTAACAVMKINNQEKLDKLYDALVYEQKKYEDLVTRIKSVITTLFFTTLIPLISRLIDSEKSGISIFSFSAIIVIICAIFVLYLYQYQ